MPAGGPRADEVDIVFAPVRPLVAARFPPWADLPIRPIGFGGWDNGAFLGEQEAFRAAPPVDTATWARGRGWTPWTGLIVCAGVPGANALEAERSRRVIEEVLGDRARRMTRIVNVHAVRPESGFQNGGRWGTAPGLPRASEIDLLQSGEARSRNGPGA